MLTCVTLRWASESTDPVPLRSTHSVNSIRVNLINHISYLPYLLSERTNHIRLSNLSLNKCNGLCHSLAGLRGFACFKKHWSLSSSPHPRYVGECVCVVAKPLYRNLHGSCKQHSYVVWIRHYNTRCNDFIWICSNSFVHQILDRGKCLNTSVSPGRYAHPPLHTC